MKSILGIILLVSLTGFGTAQAQPYPNHPVRLVLPYPPGGITDVLARTIGRAGGHEREARRDAPGRAHADRVRAARFRGDALVGTLRAGRDAKACNRKAPPRYRRRARSKEVRDLFSAQATDVVGNTPEEFAIFVKGESARWSQVVKASGAKPD